jgi:hypothetical protein
MKASWIERWKRESTNVDYMAAVAWKSIHVMDVNDIKLEHVTGKGFPIMEDIVKAWLRFKEKFYEWANNINLAQVFGNEALLGIGRAVESMVFSRERIQEIGERIREGLVRDICDIEGGILDKATVEQNLGVLISWVEYFRLRATMIEIKEKFPRKTNGLCIELELGEFVSGRRRGCKRYRIIWDGKWSKAFLENTPMNVAAGITLWGDDMMRMGRKTVELNYKLWSLVSLESGFKDFLFKLMHGKLYLNNQLANFADVERKCTFCMTKEKATMKSENVREGSPEYLRRIEYLNNETTIHLFWECRHVNPVIHATFNRLTNEQGGIADRRIFMGGCELESSRSTMLILIIIHFIKYTVYVCRNRRVLPTVTYMMYETTELITTLRVKEKWREVIRNLPELLRRVYVRDLYGNME